MDHLMQIRPVDLSKDYVFLEQWFKVREWPYPPQPKILPKTGWIVESDDGEMLAAGWVYLTNSPIRILEWTVTNPNSQPFKRLKALEFLVKSIEDLVSSDNSIMMQFIPDKKLVNFYEKRLGFKKAEDAAIMIKATNNGGK
jgi:hypothetical protein